MNRYVGAKIVRGATESSLGVDRPAKILGDMGFQVGFDVAVQSLADIYLLAVDEDFNGKRLTLGAL